MCGMEECEGKGLDQWLHGVVVAGFSDVGSKEEEQHYLNFTDWVQAMFIGRHQLGASGFGSSRLSQLGAYGRLGASLSGL